MSILITIAVFAKLTVSSAPSEFAERVGRKDHGKIVHFFRQRPLMYINVPYVHKGIIYYPSLCPVPGYLFDSPSLSQSGQPHIIHLWGAKSKSDAVIRVDVFDDVVRGDPFEVLEETDDCVAQDVCIERALSRVGRLHRGLRYNLIGNNCGNFAAWAKLGDSEADTQVWQTLTRLSKKLRLKFGTRLVSLLKSRVESFYRRRGVPRNRASDMSK
jgi:hypothetical protein